MKIFIKRVGLVSAATIVLGIVPIVATHNESTMPDTPRKRSYYAKDPIVTTGTSNQSEEPTRRTIGSRGRHGGGRRSKTARAPEQSQNLYEATKYDKYPDRKQRHIPDEFGAEQPSYSGESPEGSLHGDSN